MRKTKYTLDLLDPIVKSSKSIGIVLDKLGLKRTGGNYRNISKWIRVNNIDIDHFTGMLWNKGETKLTNPSLEKVSKKTETPDSEIFISNSRYTKGFKIIERLIRNNLKKYECEVCGTNKWMDKKIVLHLDHKNGIHNDNRIENLQILCPNCHQQTENWGAKNKRNRK